MKEVIVPALVSSTVTAIFPCTKTIFIAICNFIEIADVSGFPDRNPKCVQLKDVNHSRGSIEKSLF